MPWRRKWAAADSPLAPGIVARQHATEGILAERHPQRRREALGQHAPPGRRGRDGCGCRSPARSAGRRADRRSPAPTGPRMTCVGDAAVHHRPAFAAIEAIPQQPEVDVIQRERQRHPDPEDARRHFEARRRRRKLFAEGIVELGFEWIQCGPSYGLTFTSTSIQRGTISEIGSRLNGTVMMPTADTSLIAMETEPAAIARHRRRHDRKRHLRHQPSGP